MLGDGGVTDAEKLGELPDRALMLDELAQNQESMPVAEGLEQVAGLIGCGLHLLDIYLHTCVYMKYRIYSQDMSRERHRSSGAAPAHQRQSSRDMESEMNIDRAVLAFAGFMILASLLLAWLVSPYWLLLTAFVGVNLLQAAFTGFCPAAMAFSKLGLRQGCAFG
jgi:Protein of unknown function (DUF2892)